MKQPLALEAAALAFWVPQKNGAEDGDILTPCLNSVSLIKFVGADPEQRQARNNGAKFAVLSVATQRSWKDSNDEWQSRTEWHRVVVIWNLKSGPTADQIRWPGRFVAFGFAVWFLANLNDFSL